MSLHVEVITTALERQDDKFLFWFNVLTTFAFDRALAGTGNNAEYSSSSILTTRVQRAGVVMYRI